jgi:hypothetical protein
MFLNSEMPSQEQKLSRNEAMIGPPVKKMKPRIHGAIKR